MQMELPIEGSRFRELDALVRDDKWLDDQANRLAGWEILVRTCRGEQIAPMGQRELCDRIGYPRIILTVAKLQQKHNG